VDRSCAYDWGTHDLAMGRVAEAVTDSYGFEKEDDPGTVRVGHTGIMFINNDIRTKEERRHE